jgi:amino acid transporter
LTTRAEFRLLVLFNALLIPAAMFISTWDMRLLPPEQQAWLASRSMPSSPLHSLAGMVSFGAFIALCIGLAGLLAFQRWARWLTLAATLAIYVPMPLSGTIVLSGFAYTMDSVAAILWGVLLAVAYWSPVAIEFDSRTKRAERARQVAAAA